MKDLWELRTVSLVLLVAQLLLISGEPCGDVLYSRQEGNCTCINFIMDCTGRGYRSFPQTIGNEIKAIFLSANRLTTISQIPEQAELQTLVLTNNTIKKLEYNAFDKLDNLKTLYLSNNSISTIADDIFEWNPLQLEVLHLDGNRIEFIQHFLFYDLEELTDLYLQNNQITFIHPHAFLQLKNLRNLRLDGNRLRTFDHNWIEKLEPNSFATLRFDGNLWSCDCAMSNSLQWLQKLMEHPFLFHELMTTYPIVCTRPYKFKGRLLSNLTEAALSSVCDTPRIIGISSPAIVSEGRNVLLRCIRDGKLLPFPSLSWTAPNKDVYTLNTANNFNGIEVHQDGSLLIRNLTKTSDEGKYACTATNLKGSFTATTQITVSGEARLSPTVLGQPIATQTVIDLKPDSPGYFTALGHKACPEGCQCISRHVDCAGDGKNPMSTVPQNISADTIYLNLATNNLTTIYENDFATLEELEELSLDENLIREINRNALVLYHLKILKLENNRLKHIQDGTFKALERLTVLVLDGNKLSDLTARIFVGLRGLEWLYLRRNDIQTISNGAFTPLKNIRYIHLDSNQMTAIHHDVVNDLTQMNPPTLRMIFVRNNPFSCDCNMDDLRKLMESEKTVRDIFTDGIICSSPADLAGKNLAQVNHKLTCQEEERHRSTFLSFLLSRPVGFGMRQHKEKVPKQLVLEDRRD